MRAFKDTTDILFWDKPVERKEKINVKRYAKKQERIDEFEKAWVELEK